MGCGSSTPDYDQKNYRKPGRGHTADVTGASTAFYRVAITEEEALVVGIMEEDLEEAMGAEEVVVAAEAAAEEVEVVVKRPGNVGGLGWMVCTM
ncbi:uncharacterized protein LTR77_007057 [Saxophila tyrrhenica]|uniref:Uncharacterized protein n=1 Tax=Saxophila tyrrhenica TaxID=1690608 RepID=A0AAV9P4D3_9PEZI|nr:hypothetical protein LTR77_007057 [Saxophila tyrrhenica]